MLSATLTLVGALNGFIRWITDIEVQMNSVRPLLPPLVVRTDGSNQVERVLHYSEIEAEGRTDVVPITPPADWPNAGRIVVQVGFSIVSSTRSMSSV